MCLRLIRAIHDRCARCCLLLNTVARLPSVVVGAEAARDCCNALGKGSEDTCAAASDAYAAGNRKNCLCVVCWLVCVWLAKLLGRSIKATRDVSEASPDHFERVYESLVRKHNRITSLMCT